LKGREENPAWLFPRRCVQSCLKSFALESGKLPSGCLTRVNFGAALSFRRRPSRLKVIVHKSRLAVNIDVVNLLGTPSVPEIFVATNPSCCL
jgi:hypothetical protein